MFSSQFSLMCPNSSFWWHPHPSILPNPGQCARLVIFAWIPLLFFLLLSPAFALQFWRVRKRRNNSPSGGGGHNSNVHSLPLSPLIITKFAICLILLILAAAQLFKLLDDKNDPIFVQFPWQSILASIAKMANLFCLFFGHRFAQLHGIVSSGILHLTWMITFLCSFPDLYAFFQHFLSVNPEPTTSDSVHLSIWFCWSLVLSVQFVLLFFADPRHPQSNPSAQSLLDHSTPISSDSIPHPPTATKPSPELDSSFFSRLTYFWFRHLPSLGQKKDLTFDDLYNLNEGSRSRHLVPQWERSWLPAVERYYQRKMEILAKQREMGQSILNGDKKEAEVGEFGWSLKMEKKQLPKKPSVIYALFKMFKWELISSGLIKAIADILQFANPFLLRQLITFVGSPDAQLWQGLSLAFAMFICSEIRSLCINYYFFIMFRMGTKIQTALTAAIYKKSLQLSNSARRERTAGEIVNLMAIDVERFQMITPQIQQFWSSPFQIALALVFLFNTLGIAAIPGVVIMSIIIPLSFVSSFLTRRWQIKQMKQKDERTKLCNEILNGMKVIKLYAWEWPMIGAIERIRAKELGCLLKAGLVRSVIDTFNFTSPFLVAIGSFITFCWLNPSSLTPQIAFVSLTLFNQLRSPMTMIGFLINMIVQTAVSNQRIKEFLLAEELDQNIIEKGTEIDDIQLVDADFAWDNPQPAFDDAKKKKIRSQTLNSHRLNNRPPLQNINLNVQNGQLIAIVGKVGAGKSSLLSALLGEMQKLRGRVQMRQGISIAYVPQQAWIQNMSVRQNVTVGREFCAQFYGKVLDACALTADLSMLPQGDATEIGEKGINLSGGQKARVALARAVYSQSSVYLFDDPLSAVDSHVGKWIFDKVIGPEGILADRSRLLVTHRLHFLRKAHKIVLLDEGRIVECGTFEELASYGGKFSELMAEGNLAEGGQEEEENEMKNGDTKMMENDEMDGKGEEMVDSTIDEELTLTSVEQIDKLTHQISRQSSSQPKCRRRSQSQTISIKSGQSQNIGDGKLIEKERVETGRVKMGVYLEYMRAAGFILSFLFIFLFYANQGMQIGRNFWLSAWADENEQGNMEGNGTIGGQSDDEFRLAIYGVFGIFEALFFFLSLIALQFGSLFGSRNLHSPMLLRIMQAPMAFFDTTPIGRLLNRFGKDIEVADAILPLNIRYFVQCLTMVLATLLTICISTWVFGLVILPLFLCYYFTLRLYVPASRQLKRLESSHRSPIYSHFGESIQGASSIRAFGRSEQFCTKMDERVDGLIRIKYLSLVANRWLAIRLEFLGNCVVLFSALFGALSREWNFVSSAGLVGLSVSYALNITEVMNFAIRQISELETNIVSIERLKEYAEVETEAPWEIPDKKPPKEWPNKGEIRFAQYSTRYRAGLDLVLRNIQAEIKPTERIGIVGRTGAGKSSLTLALFRMVEPANGTIYIDGMDITKMGLHDLRSGLTIIPQEPVLFSGTLRFNLDPFNRHSDSEIWQALENSHLRDFIKELPAGLEYQISEGGENISVGQRQLLCLARALLRSTRILVLDEATASVDLSTDALIQETIRQKFRHCTVLTIAHRLETIMDYDRIMVLQQGQICEFDSPQVLLANRNSLFSSMVEDAQTLNGTNKNGNTK